MNNRNNVTHALKMKESRQPHTRYWYALLILTFVSSAAFAEKDIKPGSPVGSCCRVDGKEGSSTQRPDGSWSCKMNSIAFQRAWDAKNFPIGFDRSTLVPTAMPRVYPTCPAGWTLSAKAGQDTCTAPVAVPACPAGKQLTQDDDGTKDVCKDRTLTGQPATSQRPVS